MGASMLVRRALAIVVAAIPGVAAIVAASSSAAQEPPAPPAPSVSATTSSTTSVTTTSAPLRRHHEEPTEVEIVDLTDEPEPDPQALAIGLQAGPALFHTNGSENKIVPAADFSFTFDVGLGPGGNRVPWSIEPYFAFAITRASLSSTVNVFPDRWTEIGARIVWRGEGSLDGHWLSLGLGAVWTSAGSCDFHGAADPATGDVPCQDAAGNSSKFNLTPAFLVDVGVGLYEWRARVARYGFLLRAPFEISGHPGVGGVVGFYAQVGFRR
jgi:hypothetical protein